MGKSLKHNALNICYYLDLPSLWNSFLCLRKLLFFSSISLYKKTGKCRYIPNSLAAECYQSGKFALEFVSEANVKKQGTSKLNVGKSAEISSYAFQR